jgi:hypothetical protein
VEQAKLFWCLHGWDFYAIYVVPKNRLLCIYSQTSTE